MFRTAERLLEDCGMDFRDVVRTWIYLRDIDRDYDALNAAGANSSRARHRSPARQHRRSRGAVSRCARLFPGRVRDEVARPLGISGMSTPRLNEAWSYGADFSRGVRIVERTRSRSRCREPRASTKRQDGACGGFEAQAERMLDNVESLLARQGRPSRA